MMRQSFLMCYKSIALAFMMLIALCLTFQSKANVRKADVYVPMAEITDRSLCDFLKSDTVPIARQNYFNPKCDYFLIYRSIDAVGDTVFVVSLTASCAPVTMIVDLNVNTPDLLFYQTRVDDVVFYIEPAKIGDSWFKPGSAKQYIGTIEEEEGAFGYIEDGVPRYIGTCDDSATWIIKAHDGIFKISDFDGSNCSWFKDK